MIKRKYEKREKIKAAKFEFTYERLQYLVDYQGNGKAPDKRFDSGCEGLSLFIYPNGAKTFYACKRVEMYNKKKNRTEKNAVYKKIFRMEDHPNKNLKAAKLELPKVLAQMVKPKAAKDDKTFGSLAKDFRDKGFSGYRLADKSEKHEYKQSSINKYTKLINSYILLKGTDKIKEKMSKPIWFEDRNSNKPLKEFSSYDKDVKTLTYKIILEKFNEKYDSLTIEQKQILKEFINSVDSTPSLRNFYNSKVIELKEILKKESKEVDDKVMEIKIKEVTKLLTELGKNDKVSNDNLVDLLQYYELIKEIRNINEKV